MNFSAEALNRARRLGTDVEWRQADVRELEIGEGAYDLVVLAYLHLPPEAMRAMLARAAAGVAAGGRLVVIGHHVDNHEHGCGGPSDPAVLHDPEWIGQGAGRLRGGAGRPRRAPVDAGARRHGHGDRLTGRGAKAVRRNG